MEVEKGESSRARALLARIRRMGMGYGEEKGWIPMMILRWMEAGRPWDLAWVGKGR
jgi:hypothetical protein